MSVIEGGYEGYLSTLDCRQTVETLFGSIYCNNNNNNNNNKYTNKAKLCMNFTNVCYFFNSRENIFKNRKLNVCS